MELQARYKFSELLELVIGDLATKGFSQTEGTQHVFDNYAKAENDEVVLTLTVTNSPPPRTRNPLFDMFIERERAQRFEPAQPVEQASAEVEAEPEEEPQLDVQRIEKPLTISVSLATLEERPKISGDVWHTPIELLPPDVQEMRRARQREYARASNEKRKLAKKQEVAQVKGKVEVTDQTEPLFLRPTGE
jgi:hypothetical protein